MEEVVHMVTEEVVHMVQMLGKEKYKEVGKGMESHEEDTQMKWVDERENEKPQHV